MYFKLLIGLTALGLLTSTAYAGGEHCNGYKQGQAYRSYQPAVNYMHPAYSQQGYGMMKTGNYAAAPAPAAEAAPVAEAPKDIVDTAVAAGSFNTLAAALTAADLVEALKAAGPFTVFAPNDEAFAKIPKADLDNLLKDKEKLATVLKYHVVSGKVTAADVGKLTTADTLAELPVKIDTTSGVKINDSTVIQADIMASNGVIHVIDTVLMPPAK